MEFETSATTVEATSDEVMLRWSDGSRSRFNVLWLRDNCPTGGDKRKAFRTFSIADLDPDLVVVDAWTNDDGDLEIEFGDGHRSVFDHDWLRDNSPEPHHRLRKPRTQTHLRIGDAIPQFELPIRGTIEHCDLLDAVSEWGVALVTDIPSTEIGTERVAGLVGRVRETDSGRLSEIIAEPDAWEFSQTGLALDPRTDDPYRYTPGGCSILHCLESSSVGGESIFVDGFAVAEDLREDDPDAFDLLSETPVPFVRHRSDPVDEGEDVHLVAEAPIISLDRDHEVVGIRFDERSMAPLDIEPRLMNDYYRALISFTRMVNDPSRAVILGLTPGQAIIYDNQRVLHGQTAFGPEGGRRHLRLCTIDRDQFHSRLRRLREQHERAGVDERLPSGSIA